MAQHESEQTQAAAAALASLPLMGPRRMAAFVQKWGFQQAWQVVQDRSWLRHARVARMVGSQASKLAETWSGSARKLVPEHLYEAHCRAGVRIVPFGSPFFPRPLALDLEPPMVIFAQGDLALCERASVGVVGTRAATSSGKQIAYELGALLVEASVNVVSGLALGIDGAAHRGALAASNAVSASNGKAIAVVASGLDVIYPRTHTALWQQVAQNGLLLSEWPLGTVASKWHFPARNRLIAALSNIVVVVESHARGGSLLTAEEAIKRDRPVMAVPGSIKNLASAGSNRLLGDGMAPVCELDDVLIALGLASYRVPGVATATSDEPTSQHKRSEHLDLADATLLEHIGWQPIMLDALATLSGFSLPELSLRLTLLEARGLIIRSASAIERVH